MRQNYYHTKQKDIILNKIKKKKSEFTVKEIYSDIDKKIGLTTIYRLIDKLVQEGKLHKYIGDDNITYYQYLEECSEENHFYLKCDKCGLLIHVDCDCINELSQHIVKEHKFKPTKDNFIIHGICDKCSIGGIL